MNEQMLREELAQFREMLAPDMAIRLDRAVKNIIRRSTTDKAMAIREENENDSTEQSGHSGNGTRTRSKPRSGSR